MITKGLLMVIIGIVGMLASLFFFILTLFRKKSIVNVPLDKEVPTLLPSAKTQGIPTETMYFHTSKEKGNASDQTNKNFEEIRLQPIPSLQLDQVVSNDKEQDHTPPSEETMILCKDNLNQTETLLLQNDFHHSDANAMEETEILFRDK